MKRILLLLLLSPIGVVAQGYSPSSSLPLPIWDAPIPKSQGEFTVSLNSICSIAVENYDLEYEKKTYPVVECSIETVGGKTVRFYFIDEDNPQNKAEKDSPFQSVKNAAKPFLPEEENEKKNDDLYRVVKVYPQSATTTSVEYRLRSQDEVLELYKNLREAWLKWAP